MIIIIFYIVIIIGLGHFRFMQSKNKTFIFGLLLYPIAALRSLEFAPDPIRYVERYEQMSGAALSVYWQAMFSGTEKDPFFYFFSKIINATGVSSQVWLALISAIFLWAMYRLFKKNADASALSYVSMISLGYFYFSLTGLRQALAIAFTIFSYPYLRERKLLLFILLVAIGGLFHSSGLIFLIAYPLVYMKMGWKQLLGVVVSFILTLYFSSFIRDAVRILGWTETLAGYADREVALTISGFVIQLLVFLFCLYYKRGVLAKSPRDVTFYNLLFIGLVFQAFAMVIAEFFRISLYFSIYSTVLIVKAIRSEENGRMKGIVYGAVFLAMISYVFWSGEFFDYKFFWQNS